LGHPKNEKRTKKNKYHIHTYINIYIYTHTLVCVCIYQKTLVCVCVKLISSSQQLLVRDHVMQAPRTKKYFFIGKIQLELTILPSTLFLQGGGGAICFNSLARTKKY